jgi:hypothetical protein
LIGAEQRSLNAGFACSLCFDEMRYSTGSTQSAAIYRFCAQVCHEVRLQNFKIKRLKIKKKSYIKIIIPKVIKFGQLHSPSYG